MKYANVKRIRITDLFRKMDTDNDTFLDKDEFIDGMTKTSTWLPNPDSSQSVCTYCVVCRCAV